MVVPGGPNYSTVDTWYEGALDGLAEYMASSPSIWLSSI